MVTQIVRKAKQNIIFVIIDSPVSFSLEQSLQHSTLNETWHFDLWGLLKKRNATFHLNQELWIMKFLIHFYFLLIRGISFPFVKGKQNICFYVREQHYWQYFNCQVHSFLLTSITDISKGHTIFFFSIQKFEVILSIWHNFS